MKTSTLSVLLTAAIVVCVMVAAISGAYRPDAQHVMALITGR